MKYFRTYPLGMQLLLFLLMVFVFLSCTGVFMPTFLKLTGTTMDQVRRIDRSTPFGVIKVAIGIQAMFSILVYSLSAFVFACMAHPRPAQYLGLRAPGKPVHWPLVILVMMGAMPVLSGIQELIGHINFGTDIENAQKQSEDTFKAFLLMPDFISFARVFTVMAIVPALGEEMFFRGVMMRFAKKRSRNMLFPVLFTAAVFAYAHSNIYGMLSIFLAGVLLAVIYNLTGSLWCSIVGHLFFNGFQIVVHYLGNNNAAVKAFADSTTVPVTLWIAGAAIFSISFYLLWKNRTPLPANWADDFTKEELSQQAY